VDQQGEEWGYINEDGDRGGKAAPQREERRGEESGEQKRSQDRTEAAQPSSR
jgi:hypothetical protein